jgi:serine/threonine protein kinase
MEVPTCILTSEMGDAGSTTSIKSAPETEADNHVPSDALFGAIINERFQLSDTVLGSGSFGHAVSCYDYGASDSKQEKEDSKLMCIAKVETVPADSCFDRSETQLEHEHNVYKHLHSHPKLSKYLPKIHLFLHHQLTPTIRVPIMVMERVGKDLLTILSDETRPYYQMRTLGMMGTQLVSALKYMHDMFIVHRDIKPQNIMLIVDGPTFQLKLIDFGLSMPIPKADDPHRAIYRSTTCTLAFASWRQHFRHVCSARTDLESFIYTWVFLSGTPIPWSNVPGEKEAGGKTAYRELIGHRKRDITPEGLCYLFDRLGPDPCGITMSTLLCQTLDLKFDERPPYSKFLRYFNWLSQPATI